MSLFQVPIYGLYYYYQQQVISLPLLGVRAEASIKELAAQVKLTQTYGNDATFPIEAKYSFPIPARASVCSFVMIKQDGTRVVGSVLEKQEARETYDTAVSQGQQASLMEQQTPDVFQVSVGNIPSNEQVQIELVYATELSEDEENDSIRFHLPVHISLRYGEAPQATQSTSTSFKRNVFISSSSPTPFLTLAMSVEAIAPISKIGCPSHTVSTELGPDPKLPNFKELPFSNYARVSLSSDSPLDKDFVLTIKSAGLDTPRCVAELHPTHDTVAMGLTLVPRFKLPDLSRQEFVFMVDRSGSMRHQRIEAAKKALVVMLRALPHQDSLFQIVSFGNRSTSLWPQGSKPYNQQTLEEATRHIDSMRADYSGTEIRGALQHCFNARKLDRPMSVLVLTDGDAWDLDGVLSEVKSAVANAPKNAFLRVSVLGIGNSASTAMCEGMARVGNGTCMMVGEEETTFTGKIERMLKAAKTPPISDISVDWGRPAAKEKEKLVSIQDDDEFEIVEQTSEKKKTLNIFDEGIDDPMEVDSKPAPPPPEVLAPFPPVQQAPFKIQNLFPNIRLNVYAIVQGKTIPKTVTIRGTTVDGAEIELPISVTLSHLQNAPGAPPAVHALAARKIVQDLEDGRHALAQTFANPDDTDLAARTVKASIIRLGKTYSIVSTHTTIAETEVEEIPICIALLSAHSVHSAPTTSPTREETSSSQDLGDDSTPLTRAVVAGLLNPAGAAFAHRSHLWDNGQKISYCFLNGTPQQQRKVEDVMEEWTWYGNFTFVRLGNGDMSAFVRIVFKRGHGAWSYIGKQALKLKTGPTMQLDISDHDEMPTPYERHIILHETGHALGLVHEHQGPGAADAFGKLNEQQVLKWYRSLGKSDEEIQRDVLYFFNKTEVSNYSAFDRHSIMGYVVNPEFNSNGITADLNYGLSDMDKAYMVINYSRPSVHPKAPKWTVEYALMVARAPKQIPRNWRLSNIREVSRSYSI